MAARAYGRAEGVAVGEGVLVEVGERLEPGDGVTDTVETCDAVDEGDGVAVDEMVCVGDGVLALEDDMVVVAVFVGDGLGEGDRAALVPVYTESGHGLVDAKLYKSYNEAHLPRWTLQTATAVRGFAMESASTC